MTDRRFVHRTLAPGGPNAHVLACVSGTWQSATTRGRSLQDGAAVDAYKYRSGAPRPGRWPAGA